MINVRIAALLILAAFTPTISPDPYPHGWNGDGKGKTYALYRRHGVSAMSQGPVGSCVGAATAKALELMHGTKFSAEWCYSISRDHFNDSRGKRGSWCVWSAQAMRDAGALPAKNYAVIGYDLTEYDAKVAKTWEARGPPEALKYVAEDFKSAGYVKIDTWEQLRDSIANGVPVIVGSTVGFGTSTDQVRDSLGRLRARWWSRWPHAMVFCGVSDGKRKQALILNSWGAEWVRGPRFLGDEPDGSFWVSKKYVERMLSQDDAYAIMPIPGL